MLVLGKRTKGECRRKIEENPWPITGCDDVRHTRPRLVMRDTLGHIFQCVEFRRRHGGHTHEDEEVPMVGKISTALAAILLLGSVGIASARTVQRYDGVTNSHHNRCTAICPASPATTNTA
jgi:hypothetical protein